MSITDEIKAAFPAVLILRGDIEGRRGFGVQLNGERIAWLFRDTPENWQRAKLRALEWLAEVAKK